MPIFIKYIPFDKWETLICNKFVSLFSMLIRIRPLISNIPTAIAFGYGDEVAAAKVLAKFIK